MRQVLDKFDIGPHPANAGVARVRIRAAAGSCGYNRAQLDDVELAVGEAITNAILYGSPHPDSLITVTVTEEPEQGYLTVEVCDRGDGFDPDPLRESESLDALGGRGLRLMRAFMDRLLLYYDGNGMIVRLSKRLPVDA